MKKVFFIIMAIINIAVCAGVYAKNTNKELSDKLLRLHILANSNSEYDQNIKIKVRDEILRIVSENDLQTKKDVINSIDSIEDKINLFLKNNGTEQSAKIYISHSYFDKREYINFKTPAGKYDTIKIIIGNGQGKNWWCIAYPPLCFTKSASGRIKTEEQLEKLLSKDSYKMLLSENTEYKIRFKTVDIINSLLNKSKITTDKREQ